MDPDAAWLSLYASDTSVEDWVAAYDGLASWISTGGVKPKNFDPADWHYFGVWRQCISRFGLNK
jgi:hypothetical protein